MKLFLIVLGLFTLFSIVTATDVVVPSNLNADAIENWSPPVDSLLTAGDTVRFINDRGSLVNVPRIGIFKGEDGYIYFKTVTGKWDSLNIIAGGFHDIPVHKISPKSSGKNLHVQMKRK